MIMHIACFTPATVMNEISVLRMEMSRRFSDAIKYSNLEYRARLVFSVVGVYCKSL